MKENCLTPTMASYEPAIKFLRSTLKTKKKSLEFERKERETYIKQHGIENNRILDNIEKHLKSVDSLEKALKILETGKE